MADRACPLWWPRGRPTCPLPPSCPDAVFRPSPAPSWLLLSSPAPAWPPRPRPRSQLPESSVSFSSLCFASVSHLIARVDSPRADPGRNCPFHLQNAFSPESASAPHRRPPSSAVSALVLSLTAPLLCAYLRVSAPSASKSHSRACPARSTTTPSVAWNSALISASQRPSGETHSTSPVERIPRPPIRQLID